MTAFVHLRVHSEYSIVDGILTMGALTKSLAERGMEVCALTDQCNLFGAVKFYKACEAAGIKPILGADVWIASSSPQPSRLTLLCQNHTGYKNLTCLVSRAYMEGQRRGLPILQKNWFDGRTDGLIALSGAWEGEIGQFILAKQTISTEKSLAEWKNLFPNRFYLELQRTDHTADEEFYNAEALSLSLKFTLPVVATNNVRFLLEEDFEAHEARVCIHEGAILNDEKRKRRYSAQQYLKTAEEMAALFSDIPESLQNSVEIAKRCNLKLSLDKVFFPQFTLPAGLTTEMYLLETATKGLETRLKENHIESPEETDIYYQRLKTELDVINPMGFAGYFLIVADFIAWAKNHHIPVGPGRGSGAGSLTAYALNIIDINPLPYGLLFERFLNPERISLPDFDIDFCMDNRDKVIDYVAEKYGRESVSQIITFGTLSAKAVIRDVGRVLAYPYGFVDKLAKLIPFELGITLEKALKQEQELQHRYDKEEEVKTLFDLAKKLEGLARNAGKHAGGVVIAPSPLTDFTPLYCEEGQEDPVSQFDKNDVEAVGLVKFDFLGLRTLTIIDWAVDNINEARSKKGEDLLNIQHLPLEDIATYNLIKTGQTTAIFQLESRGIKELVKSLQPGCFEDIIALVALFRPGPLQSGMVEDFINRKHGRKSIEYAHPLLEPVLRSTYGIILYQEQVMQIAQILAGYTLGGADLLRRAMGKKKPSEMAKQRSIFIKGAKLNQIDKQLANDIFDLMEKFAGYGFNKSHSAAYALLTYQTAWLKTHYPEEFMAAVLSSDMDKTDKVVNFLQETRKMHLKINQPDINQSEYKFTVNDKGGIVYGLGAIKGAGQSAVDMLVEEREKNGAFKTLHDFCQRMDARKINKRTLEAFIKSGTLDSLGLTRAGLMANIDKAQEFAEHTKLKNQQDLFGILDASHIEFTDSVEWSDPQKLQFEKETLGFYLSGHPFKNVEAELAPLISETLLAGIVIQMRTLFTKRGDRMAFVTLEDCSTSIEITIFSDLYESHKSILVKDTILIIEGEISEDSFTGGQKLLARNLYSLAQFRQKFARGLLLNLKQDILEKHDIAVLAEILAPHKSKQNACPVFIHYTQSNTRASLQLGEEWRVTLEETLLEKLRETFGVSHIKVCY
jgi:DNA polymerase-3 subunit alpha